MKECILEDKICIGCNECNKCDLDNNKICDNCCKCIEESVNYKKIIIDSIENPDKN